MKIDFFDADAKPEIRETDFSEYENVEVLFGKHRYSTIAGKALAYVAMTRARKHLTVLA